MWWWPISLLAGRFESIIATSPWSLDIWICTQIVFVTMGHNVPCSWVAVLASFVFSVVCPQSPGWLTLKMANLHPLMLQVPFVLVGSGTDAVLMSRNCLDVVGVNGWAVNDSCAVFFCLRALALRIVRPGLRPGFCTDRCTEFLASVFLWLWSLLGLPVGVPRFFWWLERGLSKPLPNAPAWCFSLSTYTFVAFFAVSG